MNMHFIYGECRRTRRNAENFPGGQVPHPSTLLQTNQRFREKSISLAKIVENTLVHDL